MKYTFLVIAAAFLFAACNNEAASESNETATEETTTETHSDATAANAETDPVCGMTKDDTWAEYTVEGTDTTWFCSETCKTAYEGNPAKYKTGS